MTLLTKTILFASLVALILPFSVMVEAIPSEKANQIAKERSDRALRASPTPVLPQDIADKTPREKHPLSKEELKRFAGSPPPIGYGHESFGTLLDKFTSDIFGIYSKNQVHVNGITLQDTSYLYAPTILAPNNSPWEIVTYYAERGSGMEKKVVLFNHVTGAYDWSNAHTIDSTFIDDYTLTFGGNDYYYAEILKYQGKWYALLFNFDIPSWEIWDVESEDNDSISDGWVIWEEYSFWLNCPTALPDINAKLIRVYHDGSWPYATSTYASELDTGDVCGITSATFSSNYDDWSVDD